MLDFGYVLVLESLVHTQVVVAPAEVARSSRLDARTGAAGDGTDDYMLWTPVLWGLLTIVMVIGACAGSTTGGLKCIRMVILAKVSRNEFKHIQQIA